MASLKLGTVWRWLQGLQIVCFSSISAKKSVSSKDYLFLRKVKKGIFKSNQKGTTLQPLRSLTIYVHKFRRDEIPTWHKDNNRTKCLESKPPRFRGSHRSITASAFSYPIFANNREWHIKSNLFIDFHRFWRYPFFLRRNPLRKTPEPLLRYPVRPQRWIVLPCSRPAPVQRPARHWPRPCQGLLWPWQDAGEASKKQPKEWIQYIVLDISERKGCCLQEDFEKTW